jgi:TDG/mug DNA glycosylase family protein
MILSDYLADSLNVVFCGTAAGNLSAVRGHYYAGRGNKFWTVLRNAGFVSERLGPELDHTVIDHRVGLTDLAKFHSGNDDALRREMYDVPSFERKIEKFAPRYLAFNGKRAAAAYLGLRSTRAIAFGALGRTIGNTVIYLLPSTSGSANSVWDVECWRSLAKLIAMKHTS